VTFYHWGCLVLGGIFVVSVTQLVRLIRQDLNSEINAGDAITPAADSSGGAPDPRKSQ
jgi:hypothetical protein